MNDEFSHLLIWDHPNTEKIKIKNEKLILWRAFSSDINSISIPKLTEKWSDSIRNEYLDLIYRIGKISVGKRNIIDYLKIRQNFSAWWLGLLVEKSNFSKSIYINDVIKLLTFEKWIRNKETRKITLCSSNQNLISTLKNFCINNQILFELKRLPKEIKLNISIKKLFFSLPHILRGFIWFIYKLLYNYPLIIKNRKEWKISKKKYVFVSYLFNMINSDKGKFSFSSYWGELPQKLKDQNQYTYWIHLFVKDKYLKNPHQASKLIDKLNDNNNLQKHTTLYSFMNIKVIYKVLVDWIRVFRRVKKIQINNNFPIYKGFDFWEFYKNDWYDSFLGNTAIDNLIYLNLFQEAFKLCNESSVISYLLENQGWEIAMLGVCKSLNIEKTLGFSHASSRYWDLRNFYDKREYNDKNNLCLPRPKILAVNSNLALDQYLRFGYPKKQIRLVESLRHSYLEKNHVLKSIKRKNKKSLLVLGDYENVHTLDQLCILNKLPNNILRDLEIFYKPHPASKIDVNIFSSLSMNLREEPISELLPLSNLVYCGSVTSASVDAFSFGSKVVIYNDPKILNLSPLREFKEVTFVMDSTQLQEVIVKFFSGNNYIVTQRAIFELSEDLPLWKKLLYETIEI